MKLSDLLCKEGMSSIFTFKEQEGKKDFNNRDSRGFSLHLHFDQIVASGQ